ncbi:MAG: type II secretion system F family protein [Patescibacteria group bacterium]
MLYHYIAADKSGKLLEANYDADDVGQLLRYLSGKDLRPISVKPVQEAGRGLRVFSSGINIGDKVFITKYLALMLRVGTDLLSAINILIADFDKPSVKALLLEIRENLSKGRPFADAFANHPKVFSQVFVSLVRAAEASGNLQQTFEDLSASLQRDADLRNRIRSAFVYPLILLTAAFGVSMFLVTFAIPRVAKVFFESGINPPVFSRIVFGIGLFINENIVLFLAALFIIVGGGAFFFWKTVVGRRIIDRALSHAPLVRTIYKEIAVQRFASTFSVLMKAGLPIIQTTKITADVVGSEEFAASLRRVADEGLSKGLTIGEAFRQEPIFPKVVVNLVAISEKAGHLEEVLQTLADFYASDIDANIRSLVSVLEPVLLMFMGVIVGAIAIAIIVPIYQLTAQF